MKANQRIFLIILTATYILLLPPFVNIVRDILFDEELLRWLVSGGRVFRIISFFMLMTGIMTVCSLFLIPVAWYFAIHKKQKIGRLLLYSFVLQLTIGLLFVLDKCGGRFCIDYTIRNYW